MSATSADVRGLLSTDDGTRSETAAFSFGVTEGVVTGQGVSGPHLCGRRRPAVAGRRHSLRTSGTGQQQACMHAAGVNKVREVHTYRAAVVAVAHAGLQP